MKFCNFLFCFLCAMSLSYANEMSMHMDFDNHEQNITLRCRVRNDKDIFERFWINVLQNKNFPRGKAEGNSCYRGGHYKTEAFAWRPRLSGIRGRYNLHVRHTEYTRFLQCVTFNKRALQSELKQMTEQLKMAINSVDIRPRLMYEGKSGGLIFVRSHRSVFTKDY